MTIDASAKRALAAILVLFSLLLFFLNGAQTAKQQYVSYGASRERSPKWASVRAEHLRKHGECIACGGVENLNVHHIVSFSVNPSLELSPENLCTLCTKNKFGMNDHFIFGHSGNWKCRNPNVLRDSASFRSVISGQLCNEPKAN